MRSLLAALAFTLAAPVGAVTISNPTPIVIVDGGEASSAINVSGLTGNITNLTLTISGLSHTYPDDLVMGLYNESLNLGFVFMSFVGGSTDINNVTLTFSDAASGFLPESFVDNFPVTSGTYLPSNFGGYAFNNFDDAGSFAGFNGNSANGEWTLLIADVFPADFGTVSGGWSLDITTDGIAAVPEPASWALMIGGFAMTGVALRRRKAVITA
ncbi:PEPxxWA-CTERM sorting domain-containing protein [Glacieibacterium frigidum]|uniref:PEP-CTERM sorting domain-containing protein n=1 Tax=Glacieibacterium frigidum TaxID=2593303 RepID=A0A552UEM2_9SPHN|nr:PEPxxWA-CTERM sorting domain-containing protein [Glacieibacterium frigidum]TRW16675.1 PEP-CTERM sorting domain-containing protein [Glacieibacterium frigidum]